jgi:uncharacterized protein YcfJ
MKKLMVAVMCLVMLAASALPAFACRSHSARYRRSAYSRQYYRQAYARRYYQPRRVYYNYAYRDRRSFWDKHRDKLSLAIGTGAGAALGGLIGGGRGAGIGALAGLGGSALYTYKLRNRHRRY